MYSLPNILTLCRILAIPGIGFSLYQSSFLGNWIAFLFYILACLTDFFDGYLARAMRQTSVIGRFLDPIADKLLVSTVLIICVGLGRLSGLHLIPVVLIVCREIFISGLREFFADFKIRVPVSYIGKWKTTTQMLALAFCIIYPSTPVSWMFYDLGVILLWVSMVLTMWSGGIYMMSALNQAGNNI